MSIWITKSSNPDFLESLKSRTRRDDIILLYKENGLQMIGGHRGNSIHLSHQLFNVSDTELSDILTSEHVQYLAHSERVFQLTQSEWEALKVIILGRNPELRDVIARLEAAQLRPPVLNEDAAILFDIIQQTLRIFRPGQHLNEKLQEALVKTRVEMALADANGESPLRALDNLDDRNLTGSNVRNIPGEIRERLETLNRPQREEDVIAQDFYEAGVGFEKEEVTANYCTIRDPDTNRLLILYLAHRKAHKGEDLLYSDLIYEDYERRSFILIQHKFIREKRRKEFSDSDAKQQGKALELCNITHCTHRVGDGPPPEFCHSEEMRLGNCYIFYKMLKRSPKISPSQDQITGAFLPTCMVYQMLSERQRKLGTPSLYKRAITPGTFFNLMRTASIGSKPASYNFLSKLMLQHRTGPIPARFVGNIIMAPL